MPFGVQTIDKAVSLKVKFKVKANNAKAGFASIKISTTMTQ